jgi:hypothetical protein
MAIEAAFKPKHDKRNALEKLRLQLEILKHLIRSEHELEILDDKTYLRHSQKIIEISMMATGWLKFTSQS